MSRWRDYAERLRDAELARAHDAMLRDKDAARRHAMIAGEPDGIAGVPTIDNAVHRYRDKADRIRSRSRLAIIVSAALGGILRGRQA